MTTLLNGKVDDGQVLTDVPQNAVFTDTLYSKPANEPISYITGLQTALNGKNASISNGDLSIAQVSGLQTKLDEKQPIIGNNKPVFRCYDLRK